MLHYTLISNNTNGLGLVSNVDIDIIMYMFEEISVA